MIAEGLIQNFPFLACSLPTVVHEARYGMVGGVVGCVVGGMVGGQWTVGKYVVGPLVRPGRGGYRSKK